MSLYYTCLICMNKFSFRNTSIACYSDNCNYGICSECCQLTDRINGCVEDGWIMCSIICMINNNLSDSLYIIDDRYIINDQLEIYNDIMSKNRYKHIVQTYPNVLAKLISEY